MVLHCTFCTFICHMALITGIVFYVLYGLSMGQSYLGLLVEFSGIFLNLALIYLGGYVTHAKPCYGLVLKCTSSMELGAETITVEFYSCCCCTDCLYRCFRIFVIAAGAIIYKEVWNAGARPSICVLAVSAMSGS